ncbi:AP2-like ethylene-responsive transcription factor AIL7 [Andrographis paniculata]|uniref:AP2-like ethylene-responsive transcription factor AIL7 n=1 Tax=Andrographis paniculata TaxID=175694 RepID=UPI0021E9615A|nr:AP2-like ethylene-responsive transcription factor AIL7 [Andrographis paniculata]
MSMPPPVSPPATTININGAYSADSAIAAGNSNTIPQGLAASNFSIMAPDNNNWLSFSLSSMEMLDAPQSPFPATAAATDNRGYSTAFEDNFYDGAAAAWETQKSQAMYSDEADNAAAIYTAYMQPTPPKLEDFFACGGGESAETQDSSLTHLYDSAAAAAAYLVNPEPQNLPSITDFQAAPATAATAPAGGSFSNNSSSEVDDSALVGVQNQSPPVESAAEFAAFPTSGNENNISNKTLVVCTDSESCRKLADTFGQRTSIYRGVTRHRWTGRYEAHLWDNSCRREGKARKGRQVYLGGYDQEDKAARAYDLAALKYWGASATTNFPIANYPKELEEMKNMTKQEFIASLRRKSSGFSRGASIYRGVTRHHQQGRWQARIGRVAGNKDLYLGTFATEEEAAEAYDIAAIKFRGINAVTNFEMNRYDIEAIARSPLPIGGMGKRLRLAVEAEEKPSSNLPLPLPLPLPLMNTTATTAFQAPYNPNGIGFPGMGMGIQTFSNLNNNLPYGMPFDASASASAPFYHHNLFQQSGAVASGSIANPMNPISLVPRGSEYLGWPNPRQPY